MFGNWLLVTRWCTWDTLVAPQTSYYCVNYRKMDFLWLLCVKMWTTMADVEKFFFFNFRFSSKKFQCQQKLAKNITHFPANMFLFGVRKNICTAPFLDAQELHSWSNSHLAPWLLWVPGVQKKVIVLSDGGWVGGRLNNVFKAARCFGLVKCFRILHINWNFWRFNYFSAFWYFHL